MTNKTLSSCLFLLTLSLLSAAPFCSARSLPEWEAGAGIAAISLPDYRGSDEMNTYVLPVPFIVYRGEFFKADRDGVRSTLFDRGNLEVNFSVNGTLPVNSKNNAARQGMADLKPTIEIGPNANLTLWRSPDKKMKVDFRAPLRAAITAEKSPKQIGLLFSPNLNLDIRDPGGYAGWNLGMLAGLIINNRRYNAHFYSVGAEDVTATRAAYAAPGGYAGAQFTMALSKRFARYWVGGFLRYDTLRGAAFEDSPLVKRSNAVSAGVAVSWVFGQSTTMVETKE